jgi:Dolichyl-phosphate-mannose-protein mannosyltransferase
MQTLFSLKSSFFLLIIIALTTAMHWHIFELDLIGPHTWRQTETQITIREFSSNDFNILNPRIAFLGDQKDGILRLEFPLMQWTIAAFCRWLGYQVLISRIFVFVLGLLSIWGIQQAMLSVFKNQQVANLTAWAFCFSPLFYYYTINPIPDNMALSFSIWAFVFFLRWQKENKTSTLIIAASFIMLATLCKLPFILFYALFFPSTITYLRSKSWKLFFSHSLLILACTIPALLWYAWVIPQWQNNMVVAGMLNNKLTAMELFDIAWGLTISTLPEFMINYASLPFFIIGIWFFFRKKGLFQAKVFPFLSLAIFLLAYLIFEFNSINLVHDYYLMPFLPLLFLIIAYGIKTCFSFKQIKWILPIAFLAAPVACFLRCDSRWSLEKTNVNSDLIRYRSELSHVIPDTSKIIIGNEESGQIGFYYLNKRGWNFFDDQLTESNLKNWINQGATYLYSESRTIESRLEINSFFEKQVASYGSFHVYLLKKNTTP